MKCPICGSKNVQSTNMGKRIIAAILSFVASLLVSVVSRSGGIITQRNVYKSISPTRDYICLNPDCKHIFSEQSFP